MSQHSSPTSVAQFFEEWLPSRFAEHAEQDPAVGRAECTLLATVGTEIFWLSVSEGRLEVARTPDIKPPTFHLHGNAASFSYLLSLASDHAAGTPATASPALKVLKLDAETVALAANIPACLKLRILTEDAAHELVFGPGTQPVTNVGCTAECQVADLALLQRGEVDPIEMFMSGRLKLEGDLQVAMALSSVLL